MDEQQLWTTEERFWLEGASLFENLLDPACLMVFPGMGVMRAADILASLKQAPRWTSVAMTDRAFSPAGDAVIVLGYAAEAKRDGQKPYRCMCTSTYRADGQTWRMVQHQQSPAG